MITLQKRSVPEINAVLKEKHSYEIKNEIEAWDNAINSISIT